MTGFGIPELLRDSMFGASIGAIALILLACWKHGQDWRRGNRRAKWFLITWAGIITITGTILSILYRLPVVRPEPVSWWYLVGLSLIVIGVLGIVRTWGQKEPS